MKTPVVVEVRDSHGRVRSRERLLLDPDNARFTIGRGVEADIIIDDAHVAGLHAAFDIDAQGQVFVSDLGSLNGVHADGRRHRGVERLPLPDGECVLGHTQLRVRTAAERLEPEVAEHGEAGRAVRNAPRQALAGALVCLGFLVYAGWLGAPQDLASTLATTLISATLFSGGWVAAWAFVTRVMQGEWRWARHAAVLFSVLATVVLIDWLLDVLWFSLALPAWPLREAVLLLVAVVCGLYGHLLGAANMARGRAFVVALAVPLLLGGSSYLVLSRIQARNVNHIETDIQVFPPGWLLRRGGTVDRYFEEAARLRGESDARRSAIPVDEAEAD